MVRPQFSRLQPPTHLQDAKDRFSQSRPRRNRSPGYGQANYRRSPRPNRRSPLNAVSDLKGNRNNARGQYRRDNLRGVHDSRGGNRDAPRGMGNNNSNNNNNYNREVNRRPKWRRNRNKKKRRGKKRIPLLSGGNRAPVVGGNRQPIASMRMRMDDYVAPRMGRLLPMTKTNDIERAVARARREASTRTKDTFWTKKLLDAETSHPNRSFRWAHSGFKELYREELGYSELEHKEKSKLQGRSPPRGSREEFDRRNVPKRPRSPSTKQRSSRERLSSSRKPNFASKIPESRKRLTKSPRRISRSRSKSRSVSRSRSPRNRKRSSGRTDSKLTKTFSGGRKSTYLHPPNKRPYSRSLSVSPSTISSRSRSYSRSYSSYSRSSSGTSSSSSSTFTATSSGSGRSYRRSYSRSSKSWSRSPSVPRAAPAKIKTASLSKAVQSVHMKKDKKKTSTKPAVVSSQPKNFFPSNIGSKQKIKPGARIGTDVPPPNPRHNVPLSPPSAAPMPPPVVSNEYYEKEPISKSPVYVEPVDKVPFKADVRRGPETQTFKGAVLSREMNVPSGSMRSEGEQSNSESSSDDDDAPMKMTLSERFGKLAQLSSQRQEYEGVRMKIVREGGQDKKVYLEGDSRSPSPLGRRSNGAHEKWLREHKAEYDEYEERYGEFRHWDPHRDLPRELPPNWDDVNVRYRYYKESGYFGERSITMEDYLKWEEWWYRYRDWLEKYGGAQEENIKYRGPYNYDSVRGSTRDRWMRREKEDRKRHRY